MKKNKSSISKARSYAEIGEFWDKHDLSDYWGKTRKVKFDVVLEPEATYYPVQKDLAEEIKSVARKQGVTFDTLGSVDAGGTNLDTVLAVYIGPSISQLIQVAANDDYYPFTHVVSTSMTYGQERGNPFRNYYPLPLSGPSILRFNATAGTTYYIAVDSMVGRLIRNSAQPLAGCRKPDRD